MPDSSFRSLPKPVLASMEIALNRVLAGDKRALVRCQALAGRTLAVRLSDLKVGLAFSAERHGMQVRGAPDGVADVSLTGTAGAFGRALFSGKEDLAGSGLRIAGDIGIAQRFAELFSGIDFDPIDAIDARAGPVAAYVLGRGFYSARALWARAARTLPEQVAEYLREESRDAVGGWEHKRWVEAIEALDADVERLAVRIGRLSSAL
jgi:ubiquinone biosynthesis protein UbiJ